jgi:hypothetical protein
MSSLLSRSISWTEPLKYLFMVAKITCKYKRRKVLHYRRMFCVQTEIFMSFPDLFRCLLSPIKMLQPTL